MFELKPDHRVAIDEVTRTAGEFAERMSALSDLGLDDAELDRAVAQGRERISNDVSVIAEYLRERGELPDAGSVERPQLGALGVRLKSLLSQKHEAAVVADNLCEHCEELLERIDEARKLSDVDQGLDHALARLKHSTSDICHWLAELR